jgi:zinc finger protein
METGDSNDAEVQTIEVSPADNGLYELESMCMNCHDNGITRILPITVPFFKQILLESFSCDHCGFKNNTVKSAGAIQEKGTKYTFKLDNVKDFERQIVRSESSSFRVEDINLEMPTTPGQLTNLESLLSKIMTDLESDQPLRKVQQPEVHDALVPIIERLANMLEGGAFPITVTLDDPSGNSFIEPFPGDKGTKYTRSDYLRTHAQNEALGLGLAEEQEPTNEDGGGMEGVNIIDGEVYELPAECPACAQHCTVNMKKVNIPHFKDVIIMATVCEHCGYRTSDVKTGGAIPEKGKRITLRVETLKDLSRDILKSETCALKSIELDLEVQPGTLGGRFTTVEGLLAQIREQLHGQIFDTEDDDEMPALSAGDSMVDSTKNTWVKFFAKLDLALKAELKFSITLEDPLASSYVEGRMDNDPQITTEEYERSNEEKEDLGINDMQTEGYDPENGR